MNSFVIMEPIKVMHSKLLISFAIVAVGVLSGTAIAFAQWTPPATTFPNGNPPLPLDTGAALQKREGQIYLKNGLLFSTSTDPGVVGKETILLREGQSIKAYVDNGVPGTPPVFSFKPIWSSINKSTRIENTAGAFAIDNTLGLLLPLQTTATAYQGEGTLIYDKTTNQVLIKTGTNASDWTPLLTQNAWSTVTWSYGVSPDIYYDAGRVGIGTQTPREALQVGDAITFHNGGHKVIGFGWSPSDGRVLTEGSYPAEIRWNPTSGTLAFGADANSQQLGAAAAITDMLQVGGKGVGVGGAPDPKYTLDVKSGLINLGDAGSEVFIPGGGTLDRGLLIRSEGLQLSDDPTNIVSIGSTAPPANSQLYVARGQVLLSNFVEPAKGTTSYTYSVSEGVHYRNLETVTPRCNVGAYACDTNDNQWQCQSKTGIASNAYPATNYCFDWYADALGTPLASKVVVSQVNGTEISVTPPPSVTFHESAGATQFSFTTNSRGSLLVNDKGGSTMFSVVPPVNAGDPFVYNLKADGTHLAPLRVQYLDPGVPGVGAGYYPYAVYAP